MPNDGILLCCRGYAEHFEWCEVGQREAVERRRDRLPDDHPARAAFDALVESFDRDDRERDRADDYRLAVQ